MLYTEFLEFSARSHMPLFSFTRLTLFTIPIVCLSFCVITIPILCLLLTYPASSLSFLPSISSDIQPFLNPLALTSGETVDMLLIFGTGILHGISLLSWCCQNMFPVKSHFEYSFSNDP